MLRIFLMFKGQYLKTAMEYKLNFWMMVFAGILMRTLMMGVAYVLFRNIPVIAGFVEGEVYLIMAFMFLTEGMCNIFFDGIWSLPAMVFNGQFDVLLIRPVSPLYQVLSMELGLQGIGVLALGSVSLILAMQSLGWLTVGALLLCALFVLCGTVLRMSTYLIGASSIFYMDADGSRVNIPFTMYSVGEFAKYPVSLYPMWMQAVLFVLIPFGFIGYIPTLLLRGERPLLYGAALALMTAGYFLVARGIFYHGIKRYESMGM